MEEHTPELHHGTPHMPHEQELLATLKGPQQMSSAVGTSAHTSDEIGTIVGIQEVSAGAIWGTSVTVQYSDTAYTVTRFLAKRVWGKDAAGEAAFRADVRAALNGAPSDYSIPLSVLGTGV